MNKVIIKGNLTRDPELKYSPAGTAISHFTIAVNRTWKSESGEKKEEVGFFDCVTFGRTAETIAQYIKKGDPILIEGRLKQETWDDKKTNQKRSKVIINAESFDFINGRKEGGQPGAPTSKITSADVPKHADPKLPEEPGDFIPF